MQGTNENHLQLAMLNIAARCPSEPQDVADESPSCRFIAGSLEARWVYEGFGKPDRMTMGVEPILRKAF